MKPQYEWPIKSCSASANRRGSPTTVPFRQLTREQQKIILQGRNGFDGVKGFFDWLETKKYKLSCESLSLEVPRIHSVP